MESGVRSRLQDWCSWDGSTSCTKAMQHALAGQHRSTRACTSTVCPLAISRSHKLHRTSESADMQDFPSFNGKPFST